MKMAAIIPKWRMLLPMEAQQCQQLYKGPSPQLSEQLWVTVARRDTCHLREGHGKALGHKGK